MALPAPGFVSRSGLLLVRVPLVPHVNPNGQAHYFQPNPPIDFSFSTTAGPCLISIQEMLDMNCPEEWNTNNNDPFGPHVQRISCRVNWAGFPPRVGLVNTKDFRHSPTPLSKAKLARNVARAICKVLEDLALQGQTVAGQQGHQNWAFDGNMFNAHTIFLGSLEHVSHGSWQPELYCNDPAFMAAFLQFVAQ
ncbi:hypothetical protein BDW22DRAFT_1359964 [Trametopsis cervina]|nr:hypothetical protein BDW22DRAFT_1359964 [Trametopsis cervina]